MDKARARQLVERTFTRGFDRGAYALFLRELLRRYDELPVQIPKTAIPQAFRAHVRSAERLGTYRTAAGEVVELLIVHLESESKLARARTALRDFGGYLLDRYGADAALVAFVAPDDETWRFSYVKLEFVSTATRTGKIGVRKELTPARRLSYLVGTGESCHTAQSRFVDLLTATAEQPCLQAIEAAFSVEAVTKEFFDQYKELFLATKDQLDALAERDPVLGRALRNRHVSTIDLTKKLLGQIVFLYFLQKKGWMGVSRGGAWGSGPTNFLRLLVDRQYVTYDNFFDEVLEPLFYDSLATDRGADAWDDRLGCRIPFLNGGLFEPLRGYDWKGTRILLPNALFTNAAKNAVGDTGTGIFDVFDRYNFTVNEAEPLEKDVAIDPEMLGKVFENLLEVRERKSKGSFYTPREIVHYMCEEALINYLDNVINAQEVALAAITPTQAGLFSGSGEGAQAPLTVRAKRAVVPRSDLEVFVRSGEQASHWETARKDGTQSYRRELPKAIEAHAALLDEKLAAVRVCDPAIGSGAFLVGMMTEIVRARIALNAYLGGDAGRTPYDFKRHAIHSSLYGVDVDPGAVEIAKLRLWLSLVVDEVEITSIRPLPNLDYKVVAGNSLLGFPFTSTGLQRVEQLKEELTDTADAQRKVELRDAIEREINLRVESSVKALGHRVDFDFRLFFSEVFAGAGGFDIIIANPPYVSAWAMEDEDASGRRAIQSRFRQYKVLKGHWDLYVAFVLQGFDVLNPRGVLTYVLPNPVLREKYATELRRFILDTRALSSLLTFQETNMFENVSRKTVVLVVNAAHPAATVPLFRYRQLTDGEGTIAFDREVDVALWKDDPTVQFRIDATSGHEVLAARLEASGVRLGNLCYVNYGAQLASKEQGAFKKKDIVGKERRGNAKPFYDGKDLQRWSLRSRSLFLDYRKEQLYRPRTEELFETPKIAIRNISDGGHRIAGTLDETGWYCDHTVVLVVPYEAVDDAGIRTEFAGYDRSQIKLPLEFIAASLLSKPTTFYYRVKFANESLQQATSHIFPQQLRALPIPLPAPHIVDAAVSLVRSLLRTPNGTAQRAQLEAELETLMFDAYGVTGDRSTIEAFLEGRYGDENAESNRSA